MAARSHVGLPAGSTVKASSNVEAQLLLFDALAKMPPGSAVVVLRFWEDLDVAETAAVLDCNQGTVKGQRARGLAKLRELLAPEHLMEGQPR